jgi:hypothetical protein
LHQVHLDLLEVLLLRPGLLLLRSRPTTCRNRRPRRDRSEDDEQTAVSGRQV